MRKLIAHLRTQWMGALALFLVLAGGTAWAASELSKNEVKSKHIAKKQVKKSDLANDAVNTKKVKNASLLGEDFAPGQLPQGEPGPQGERGLQGERGPQGEQGIQGPAQPRVQQFGTTTDGACADDDQNGDQCASVAVNLASASSLHITANGNWINQTFDGPGADNTDEVQGICELRLDGVALPGTSQRNGERRATAGAVSVHSAGAFGTGALGLTGFRASVPAGAHTVSVFCTQVDGDIDWNRVHLAVTAAPLP